MPGNQANAADLNIYIQTKQAGFQQIVKDSNKIVEDTLEKPKKEFDNINKVASAAAIGMFAVGVEIIKATQAAMIFEDAFAGIRKTVEATEDQFKELGDSILRLSTVSPVSASDLARIGELGGQLGVAASNLPTFIKTVSDLAISTNLTVDNAALGLARLDAIAQQNGQTFDNMAAAIVDLGNNFAATEGEIMTTVLRIAQAAAQVGAGTEDALAFATALQGIGVPAQAGGTAVARVFQGINQAVIQGGANLQLFGKVAATTGKTTEDSFEAFFRDDPARATQAFIEGLNNINESGQDVIAILDQLGLSQRRTMLAILGLAEAGDLLGNTIDVGRQAFEDNTAATEEAIKKYSTLKSQIDITKNTFNELQVQIGQDFLPIAQDINQNLQQFILGITATENAATVLKGLFGTLTLALGGLAFKLEKVRKIALLFVGGPVRIGLTLIATVLGAVGVNALVSAGKIEQLKRQMESFNDSGETTESTIRAVIKANKDFQDMISGFDLGEQYKIENTVVDAIFGDKGPKEVQAEIEETVRQAELLNQVAARLSNPVFRGLVDFKVDPNDADALQDLIRAISRDVGVTLTEEEALPWLRALKDGRLKEYAKQQRGIAHSNLEQAQAVEEIYKKMYPAMLELEEKRLLDLKQQAMIRLGITEVEHDFQRIQISNMMKLIELENERADNQTDFSDQIQETANIFTAIEDNVVKGTESLFDALEGVGEMSELTAEEINKNLAEKIRLKEIFQSQIDFLMDKQKDDAALFFSKLGPEAAASLQNLIDDPNQLSVFEQMLESLDLSETGELKDALLDEVGGMDKLFQDELYAVGEGFGQGFVKGLEDQEDIMVGSVRKVMKKIIDEAYSATGVESPSRYTTEMGEFLMLGLVKGFQAEYPNAEMVFKGTTIDLIETLKTSIEEAIGEIQSVFNTQFGLFTASRNQNRQEKRLNDLLKERSKLLKGNTAEMTKNIEDARDKRDFLKIAYEEGTISLAEYQLAEENLSKAENARQERLDELNQQIEDAKFQQAQAQFNLGMQAFQLLQMGPEAITMFKDLGKTLGIDNDIIEQITGKTEELSQTLGTKFGGEVDKIAQKFFDTNLRIEQDAIEINVQDNTDAVLSGIENRLSRITGSDYKVTIGAEDKRTIPMMYGGGRIPMYANGGTLRSGLGLVGEYGPELIRAIPGGGVDITPIGQARGSNITIHNLNVNVSGVPSDPMQARKAAIEIRKALVRLDKEGLIGTGIRGR